jgi:Isy1-like splicing family.
MARPEEKAQAMLNKWVKMRESENTPQVSKRRPYLASQCEHLNDAERWRRQIIREISRGISKIQNPGLGEHAIRDLNDEINKLMREKYHWNKRIVELGGPDYNKIERQNQLMEQGGGKGGQQGDSMGLEGSSGYRYYGAAKDLPGVKELFARNAAKITKKKRGNVYKYITPDYYGLRDEEDGVLLEVEEKAAQERRSQVKKLRQEYRLEHSSETMFDTSTRPIMDTDKFAYETDEELENFAMGTGGILGTADAIAAHVAVPTRELVQQTILERKKKALLDSLQ